MFAAAGLAHNLQSKRPRAFRRTVAGSVFGPAREGLPLPRERYGLNVVTAALHRGGDPRRSPIGDSAQRIGREMGITFGGAGLPVAEHLADHEQRVPVGHGERGEGVAEIM